MTRAYRLLNWNGRPERRRLPCSPLLVLFALIGPLAWPDHAAQDLSRFLEPPSLAEPLGRDHLGRSVVARLAHATQLSL